MPSPCSALKARSDRRGRACRLRAARPRRPGPRPCWRRRSPASIPRAASGRFPRRAGSAPRAHRSGTGPRRPRAPPPRSGRACGPGRLVGSSSSKPAVSITRKVRSNSRASPSRRSRVTPGRSSTSARRRPTSRLNRVDLPTLGRPMMATVGRGMAPAPCPPDALAVNLAEGGQPARRRRGCRASSWRPPAAG